MTWPAVFKSSSASSNAANRSPPFWSCSAWRIRLPSAVAADGAIVRGGKAVAEEVAPQPAGARQRHQGLAQIAERQGSAEFVHQAPRRATGVGHGHNGAQLRGDLFQFRQHREGARPAADGDDPLIRFWPHGAPPPADSRQAQVKVRQSPPVHKSPGVPQDDVARSCTRGRGRHVGACPECTTCKRRRATHALGARPAARSCDSAGEADPLSGRTSASLPRAVSRTSPPQGVRPALNATTCCGALLSISEAPIGMVS